MNGNAGKGSSLLPPRTLEQRDAALRKANAIRSYRKILKQNLAAGTVDVCGVLADPTPEIATMRVSDLLGALPKRGPVKTKRLMVAVRISDAKTVGGLSNRQRGDLCRALA